MRRLKNYLLRAIVDCEGASATQYGPCLMTDAERHTLSSRISKYMRQCEARREQEAAKAELDQKLGDSVCIMCNDTGEVRKKVWNPDRRKWVYADGTMTCPSCVDENEPELT